MKCYQQEYKKSIDNPKKFWQEVAEELIWFEPYKNIITTKNDKIYSWFNGGKFNISYNCLDRHIIEGRGEQPALIYDSPVTSTKRQYNFQELTTEVAKVAGVLQNIGVKAGDRVIVYMPMIPEAIMAMLAIARIGAIHSVVFGGFAAKELAKRIEDAKADSIISASCGIEVNRIIPYKEILDEAIFLSAYKPKKCLILQRPQLQATLNNLDVNWHQAIADAKEIKAVPMPSESPLYILYTSGTTGMPKGILRQSASQAVGLKWTMKNIYDVDAGDVYWAASDIGWVVGHSYIVYGPLLQGATTIVYEGKPVGTPDAGAFWRMIEEYKINVLFTAPTAIRVIKQQDNNGKFLRQYSTSSLKYLFLAGERSDPDTIKWSEQHLKIPVIDHWWQTETSWAIVAKPMGMTGIENRPIKPGSASFPMPGYKVKVLDDNGIPVEVGVNGNLVIELPLPPGTLHSLWGNDNQYIQSYLSEFPGYYSSGDAGFIDEEGYVFIMGRTDDVINVAGHRISTGAIEEVLSNHPDVAEAAVFSKNDSIKGEVPVSLVVLNQGINATEELMETLITNVRKQIGAVVAFKNVAAVAKLPKTRSGKTLRNIMRKIAKNEDYVVPPTIEDPAIIDIIKNIIKKL